MSDPNRPTDQANVKKEYFPPHVVHTEKLESRAVSCTKGDDSCSAGGGSIQS